MIDGDIFARLLLTAILNLVLRITTPGEFDAVICGAETKNGPCQAEPMPNRHRCFAHKGVRTATARARQIACASAFAIKQWSEARGKGQHRLGELPPEGLDAIVRANKGRPKPAEHRAKIGSGIRKRHRQDLIAAHGQKLTSILVASIQPSTAGH
jgi:hypothetical protein